MDFSLKRDWQVLNLSLSLHQTDSVLTYQNDYYYTKVCSHWEICLLFCLLILASFQCFFFPKNANGLLLWQSELSSHTKMPAVSSCRTSCFRDKGKHTVAVTTPQVPLLFVFAFVFIISKKSRIIFSCDLHQIFISCKDVF